MPEFGVVNKRRRKMTEEPQKKFKDLAWDETRGFKFNIFKAESRAYKGDVQSAVLYFADALNSLDNRLRRVESIIDELGKMLDR